MDKVSTLFLKIAVIFLGIPILALCIFAVPNIGSPDVGEVPEFLRIHIKCIFPFILYISTIPFYFALYKAFSILRYIDQKQAFSILSVDALMKIKYCAISISILHLFALPFFYTVAELDDAPGFIFVGLIVPFASMVIAVFAAVLQKLLKEAIALKSENDLTI